MAKVEEKEKGRFRVIHNGETLTPYYFLAKSNADCFADGINLALEKGLKPEPQKHKAKIKIGIWADPIQAFILRGSESYEPKDDYCASSLYAVKEIEIEFHARGGFTK